MKVTIIKAPTGFGKTALAIEKAKEKPVIAAVPTLKLGKEIERRANESGLKAVFLEGRMNYPCGYKVKKEYGIEDEKKVREICLKLYNEGGERRLFQGYLCCRRSKCPYDMFKERKEKASGSDVVIVTHSFLKINAFAPLLPQGRVLFIDEIHSFLNNIKTPAFPYNSISTAGIKSILLELKPILKRKKKLNAMLDFIEKEEREFSVLVGRKSKLLWTKKNGTIVESDVSLVRKVRAFCGKLTAMIDDFNAYLKEKEKIDVGDIFTRVKTAASMLESPIQYSIPSGSYAVVKAKKESIDVQICQVLFSKGMWQMWNGIIENLQPEETVFMSATVPQAVNGLLKTEKITGVERKEYYHRFNSTLDVIIGSESYSYETRKEFLDYFVAFFRRFKREKGAVILASSYRDIEYLAEALSEYPLAVQKEGMPSDRVLSLYEERKAEILIGNRSFWEGINIIRDSDFFVVKVPYSAPDDPDYTAGEIYWDRDFFAVHKTNVRDLLVQGLGRIIRRDGEHKRVFIADRRILSFECVFAEIPARKRYLLL